MSVSDVTPITSAHYLSADDILSADDLGTEDVDVPEWGGKVRVRGLTGTERDQFEARFVEGKAKGFEAFSARLVAACAVDADGKRLFQGEAVTRRLGAKSAVAMARVSDVARRLSGFSEEDRDELAGN